MRAIVAAGRRTLVALLAATILRLWDGRTLEAVEWIRHGEEYVVTLRDGTVLILRAQEVREVEPPPRPPGR
ncbi:MAG: hypothetical protein A3F92_09215 [Candidatus Rokubacteria bacterium RIFCSPLOWO2_12_FULL_71_22]|nr:MAG: hypothetical protein A3F92_09215 [Candidatus Rokubacteria bacterium RIFCSPLOWO2_12_FULL_71_22]